jgi:TetR/AcrR family transcriptional regulator, transcriptional repressor for nem operon
MSIRIQNKGAQTRERLMNIAQEALLHKGFASTSIDEIIAEAGITKSGFFYHFRDKNHLAKALLERYIEEEHSLFDELFAMADGLNEDPLHGFLIFLKMLADRLADIPNGHPGCLVASYCYQDQLFSQDVRELNAIGLAAWRKRFRERVELIAERYPPKVAVDFDGLADMLSACADGGIILSKSMRDPTLLPQQIMLYRAFVRTVFLGA